MTSIQELRAIADQTIVSDGGRWPINESGAPQCDRCERDAVRVAWSSPDSAVFFCESCDEHDPCDPASIVRRAGDPNSPLDPFRTKFHRDGTVTLWNVYSQQWERTDNPGDRVLASLDQKERERVMRHCQSPNRARKGD